MRLAILTVSDAGSRGERADLSGDAIAEWARARGTKVVDRAVSPDEPDRITEILRGWADQNRADLVLTTGGTGLTPRDVTPEATRAALEREAPGIAEALRVTAYPAFHRAALSRGVAGGRRRPLQGNRPGSTSGVRDGLAVLEDLVDHAVDLVRGERTEHG